MHTKITSKLTVLLNVLVTSLAVVALASPTAYAAVSSSQHAHPWPGVAGVGTICAANSLYNCMSGGYKGTNATGWAKTYYGCPNASGCAVGTPHNCTLYAGYMMMQNGIGSISWHADAKYWATNAASHGVVVNQTPYVGAIAQWNSGTMGHVAYVDAVDSTGITVTMDDYYTTNPYPNGYTYKAHINYYNATSSPAYPDNFIHFYYKPSFYAGKIVQWDGDTKSQKTSWLVSSDLKRYWIPSTTVYNCLKSHGHADAGPISSSILNTLTDQTGHWATCN